MELKIAIDLIRPCVLPAPGQLWWDLGAGSGVFTMALAKLLPEGTIIAADNDTAAMKSIPDKIGNVEVKKLTTDFARFTPPGGQPNGIIMANSLHFVSDKLTLLTTLKSQLVPDGRLIIIEYEMRAPNAWVPFPIDFNSLSTIAINAGFVNVRKLGTTASRFQSNGIYSAGMTKSGSPVAGFPTGGKLFP